MERLITSNVMQTVTACGMIVYAWFSDPRIAWLLWMVAGWNIGVTVMGYRFEDFLGRLAVHHKAAFEAMAAELDRRQAEIDRLSGPK